VNDSQRTNAVARMVNFAVSNAADGEVDNDHFRRFAVSATATDLRAVVFELVALSAALIGELEMRTGFRADVSVRCDLTDALGDQLADRIALRTGPTTTRIV